MKKISVIVATYNQLDYLMLTLESIAKQKYIDFGFIEVLIADDGSSFLTKNYLDSLRRKYPFKLLHVWHEDFGFRKAMILNKAVLQSCGDYLIFIDGDCVIPNDFIAQQVKLAEAGFFVAGNRVLLSEDYTSMLVTEKIKLFELSIRQWFLLFFTKKTNKLFHFLRLSCNAKWRKFREKNWKYPKGCNIAIWKSDYYLVNGYDESFSGWGHEDADLFIRLIHSGVLIKDGRFSVPVYHLWHKFNSRDNEADNMQKLLERVNNSNIVRAVDGINKYE